MEGPTELCQNGRAMAKGPLVLVIDDETGSRESMSIGLERAGLSVRGFDDARKALAFLKQDDQVRLAICDLRMPEMDGLAFLNEVRRQQLDLGVILVTGFGSVRAPQLSSVPLTSAVS